MNFQDKIRGCFLGCAVGDALGKPIENMSAEQIKQKYGKITDYISNSEHKWFSKDEKGTTSDDWSLTRVVANSFIITGEFNLGAIAAEHYKEFTVSVSGWGSSTREAVARIADGIHWTVSGKSDNPNRGFGNGVCMKAAPVGIYLALKLRPSPNMKKDFYSAEEDIAKLVEFSAMTHRTNIGVASGIAHSFAIGNCFLSKKFDEVLFIKNLMVACQLSKKYFPETIKDNLEDRFEKLKDCQEWSDEKIRQEFGEGSCYVYDSLPFAYAHFLKNPNSIESLYECLNNGGDCDSTGALVGSLLGALHGTSIFPQHLIDGLVEKEEVLEIADKFYKRLVK